MIELQRLTKRYGATIAVEELTFTVAPGRVTGFLGPNGAGKSTTVRMVLGLDHPTRGRALLRGVPYQRLQEPLRQVGALLEATATHRARTAYHHLLWLAHTHRIGRWRVLDVLESVGLSDVARKRVGGFSLGMRQRLGLAAALLGDPGILLLDEPRRSPGRVPGSSARSGSMSPRRQSLGHIIRLRFSRHRHISSFAGGDHEGGQASANAIQTSAVVL